MRLRRRRELPAALVAAAIAAHRTTQARVDAACTAILRTLFAYGFFDRDAYSDDDSRDRPAPATPQAAQPARGGRRPCCCKQRGGALPLDAAQAEVARADRRRRRQVQERRRLVATSSRTRSSRRAQAIADARRAPASTSATTTATTSTRAATAGARGGRRRGGRGRRLPSEGADKPCLSLDCAPVDTADQDALIDAGRGGQPASTVVVLETGGPVLTPVARQGQGRSSRPGTRAAAAAPAIARVLFGDVDPGGRLPATFPRREADLPTAGDPEKYPGVEGRRPLQGGRRSSATAGTTEQQIAPAFPFGFGLSYTRSRSATCACTHARHGLVSRRRQHRPSRRRRGAAALPRPARCPRRGVQPPRQLKGFDSVTLRRGRARPRALPRSAPRLLVLELAAATAGRSRPAATAYSWAARRATSRCGAGPPYRAGAAASPARRVRPAASSASAGSLNQRKRIALPPWMVQM